MDVTATSLRMVGYFLEIGPHINSFPRYCFPFKPLGHIFPIVFFDANSVGGVPRCIEINTLAPSRQYNFFWFGGMGTNMRAEVMVLWGVLQCTLWLEMDEIIAFGDFKVTID